MQFSRLKINETYFKNIVNFPDEKEMIEQEFSDLTVKNKWHISPKGIVSRDFPAF